DYVQINYHSATEIYKALTEAKGIGSSGGGGQSGGQNSDENGFLSPRGRLVADERTNTLMISDIPKKVASMRELIGVIDRPVDQVLIEARIVVATDTFARDLGAKFGIGGTHTYGDNVATVGSGAVGGGTAATRGLNVNLPANNFTNGAAAGAPSLAYTLLGANFNLDLELSALQEEGRGEVISNPRIITANQREGDIKQGTEIGYVTITGGTAGAAATPNVQFKEALLELKVTPTITHDGRVFLNMFVKKDDVNRYITLEGYGVVPELNRREINTAVLVEDGQTVVIGGVYEFTDRASVSKVPFLGDIPFLGNLFKKQGKQKNKAELLIFVTPKVIAVRQ
ncbi:MAG: type IV pilus secretin PilQ, partial [Pseudoxanthomonas sp.]